MPIRTYLTPAEITQMIDSADNIRDKFILSFLADTGCRVSELLAITPGNIDLERQEVIIPHLKRGAKKTCPRCNRTAGRASKFCSRCGTDLSKVNPEGIEERSRMISIGKTTCDLLQELFRSSGKLSHDKPVIRLSRQMIYYIVRRAAINVNLTGKVFINPESGKHHYIHCHDFRSALAVSWLEYAGSDATKQKALQEQLGHKDFSTTMRYNKLSPSAVRLVSDEVRAMRFGAN